jgi:hypothetical protein
MSPSCSPLEWTWFRRAVSFVLPPQTVPNRIFPRCSQVGKIEVGIGTRMQAIVALTVVAFEPNPNSVMPAFMPMSLASDLRAPESRRLASA